MFLLVYLTVYIKHTSVLAEWKGGGRSSARETIGRVAAGALAKKILKLKSGVEVCGLTLAIFFYSTMHILLNCSSRVTSSWQCNIERKKKTFLPRHPKYAQFFIISVLILPLAFGFY